MRTRERVLQRFKSAEHAQRFLEPFSAVRDQVRREIMHHRFGTWREVVGVAPRP